MRKVEEDSKPSRPERLSRLAPAKINLFLHITGRRADGYHLLESLVAFADFGDELTAAPASGSAFTLAIEGPFAQALTGPGAHKENLVLRAAERLKAHTGTAKGAALTLDKRLPVASGLGGGSADAAAAFHLLNALWGLGLDGRALAALGAPLGADVPVCIGGTPALVSGIGEAVEPYAGLPPLWLVLINPGVALPTPAVYRAYAAAPAAPRCSAPGFPKGPWTDERQLIAALSARANDLEAPAIALCPKIAEVLSALRAQEGCALARMSGSGASCFGLFSGRAKAGQAAQALARAEPAWWVRPARLLAHRA